MVSVPTCFLCFGGRIWGLGLTPLSGCFPGLDSEVLCRSSPSVPGDAELKQALLAGKSLLCRSLCPFSGRCGVAG